METKRRLMSHLGVRLRLEARSRGTIINGFGAPTTYATEIMMNFTSQRQPPNTMSGSKNVIIGAKIKKKSQEMNPPRVHQAPNCPCPCSLLPPW